MKQAYTQYRPPLTKWLKEMGGISFKEAAEKIPDMICAARSRGEVIDENEVKISLAGFCLDSQILAGNCIHYFLPDNSFCQWLVGCVRNAEKEYVELMQTRMQKHAAMVFHFPTGGSDSFAFYLWTSKLCDDKNCKDFPIGLISLPLGCGAGFCGQSFSVEFDGRELPAHQVGQVTTGTVWFTKLLIGIGMYMECFPETVMDGPPTDLKHPSHHKYTEPKWIQISEKISLGGTHASPIAHFRKGHFRVLRSEKFTNKRFQAVFVHEAFVNKAKAKTVLSPEEVSAAA